MVYVLSYGIVFIPAITGLLKEGAATPLVPLKIFANSPSILKFPV